MKKLFVLIFGFAVLIGVGILVLPREQAPALKTNTPAPNEENGGNEEFAISEQLARSIIRSTLDDRFDETTATYTVANLDDLEGSELIIGAKGNNIAIILVVSVLGPTGTSERIGSIEYQEFVRTVPEVQVLQDVTGDGRDELLVSLGYGGAANDAHGFLQLDSREKKLKWIQLQDSDGQTRDAIFLMGGTVTHTETVRVVDINDDGKQEIVELFTQIQELGEPEDGVPRKRTGEIWCLARAYQWSGSLFTFNHPLSEQFLKDLGSDCAM